jgi:hypothetical protein
MARLLIALFFIILTSCNNKVKRYKQLVQSSNRIEFYFKDNGKGIILSEQEREQFKNIVTTDITPEAQRKFATDININFYRDSNRIAFLGVASNPSISFANFGSDSLNFGFRLTYRIGMFIDQFKENLQRQAKREEGVQNSKASAKSSSPGQKVLVPYSDLYQYDAPKDTITPDGTYLLHLVNADTTDLTLYIKYGNKNFDSLLVIESGIGLSPCHHYQVCYATKKTLAIVYQCMNSRGMTLLPLGRHRPVIEYLNPLYIGAKQGFTISLMSEEDDNDGWDSLLVADLDFRKKQFIRINRLVCGDRIQCFDDVKVKGNKVYLTYTGAVPDADPRSIRQIATIEVVGKKN